ncbi:alcohol dehydrogenase catalytic domain-containing protein [Microbacterium sp. ASV49]|uniref:alcohol dehydrogenase n=1 Tax=Microbacterium candidum TaxID=3041922 RepID=A0ABT7MY43_9MICO|nr:alcohol dehydrogenase catalytic domain-containing protein [Microbacterium sp. ASV49]MDL9979350.1 alcohol dehydrogenase catalytic domain-containing protein [Microbacterium sp. ASV49]
MKTTLAPVGAYRARLDPAATAQVWFEPGRPHEAMAVLDAPLADGEALVAVELSTICGSDVHTVRGDRPTPVPTVLGHESVGRIVAVGTDAVDVDGAALRPGDRVVWSVTVSCGTCGRCERGIPQKCTSLRKYGHEKIQPGWQLNGGFATHVHVRAGTAIVKVAEGVPAEALAPVSCGVATAWAAIRAIEQTVDLEDATLLVTGAGLIGLVATAIATDKDATVIVSDPDAARRARAIRFGARAVYDPRGVDHSAARAAAAHPSRSRHRGGEIPGGLTATLAAARRDQVDAVVEASGSLSAVGEALDVVGVGGVVALVGSVFSAGAVPLDPERVVRGLVTVRGVHNYTSDDLRDAVRYVEHAWRRIPLYELTGATLPLSRVDDAFALAARGQHVRVGVDPRA